jgi:hypothetical protein
MKVTVTETVVVLAAIVVFVSIMAGLVISS